MKTKFAKAQPWIGLISRLILGGVLLAAGVLKIDKTDISQMAVRSYELLPIPIANMFGLVLPFFEVAIGALLILGALTRVVAILGGVTMFIFIIAIAQAWARGLNIDCGCFGGGGSVAPEDTRYLQEILRDAGLVFLAIYLIRYPVTKFSIDKNPLPSGAETGARGDVE
jgi:uncharacterized membrane protein YphA (DoxX/SURF4 family)